MNNIIEPNQLFDFSKISLANPSGVQGGAYFTKILYNLKPLYIQTQQSLTRQGFIKTGKKYYIDLMFDNNSADIINWFENLEEKCQSLLFDKSPSWFQNTLELNDIESAFNSTIRVYKSGKYYLVRCNAKSNPNGEPQVKIYNEDETTIPYTDISNEVKMISILEIQGIKFTSRNFQIEIEIKQIMTINDEPIFESCLIKTNNLKKDKQENIEKNQENTKIDLGINTDINKTLEENKEQECLDIIENFNDSLNTNGSFDNIDNKIENINQNNNSKNINNHLDKEIVSDKDELNINLEFEDLDILEIDDNKDLKEVDIDINNANNLETLTLKKPNQVYFELYKEAREKAKIAKKAAIIAYLEAKNIKKTYMIDNLNDSDSDFDAEIDEVSESELEGL
jgi:hypothetical protein